MHKDKQRITYKTEGNGFHCDALCEEGYTYQIYFINHPAPEKYLQIGIQVLQSRVLAIIDCVQDKYHVCGMDKLYNYVTFCKSCYMHPYKLKTQGSCSKGCKGIPCDSVHQKVTSIKGQRAVIVMVKPAVLQGDTECPNIVTKDPFIF